ncbi:MAG: hypothetical protein AB1424_16805 [Thermodesulfobacteriota bacterium]
MKIKFIAVAVTLFFLLPGSSCFGEAAEKYYPLKEGMTWVYGVTADRPGALKIKITNLAPRELQGQTVTPRKWEVGASVRTYFIAKDDFGVYRYAEQMTDSAEPKVVTPKVYYLKNPVDKGTYWDISTKMGENDLKVTVTIEGIREKVTVPAGTYNECVKVKHEGGTQDAKTGLSLTAYEWYAPAVGLVKSMFTIKKKGEDKKEETESTTYQLESFKP